MRSQAAVKVLLSDDHPLVRQGLSKVLSLENDIDIVAEAVDGEDTLKKVEEYLPDVVLMDVNMPVVNGIEATRRIKQRFNSVDVIALTFHDEDEYVLALMRAGAKGYILKDTEPSVIATAIRKVHHGECYYPSNLINQVMEKVDKNERSTNLENDNLLTKRELEILEEIVQGKSNKEIADTLFISEKTVKNHVSNVLKKLDVTDRTQAAVHALRSGIVPMRELNA
ncbi:MAG: response regulator transcription factor [Firmicutes bacterium]|nr:response regulator transcription factor [Bacillota bacterium]MDD4263789.1 response regulator transcription factor [Bacillota bacterium]MDD4693216.1 response regulator transcription factor [Bacillota bacterium]